MSHQPFQDIKVPTEVWKPVLLAAENVVLCRALRLGFATMRSFRGVLQKFISGGTMVFQIGSDEYEEHRVLKYYCA